MEQLKELLKTVDDKSQYASEKGEYYKGYETACLEIAIMIKGMLEGNNE